MASKRLFELGYDFSHIVPVAADPAATTKVAAGAVTIGLEHRSLDENTIVQTVDEHGSHLARNVELSDSGLSLHVFDTATGKERLRFDCFEDDPHYHYMNPNSLNRLVVFDSDASGDMLNWAVGAIRHRLPQMLRVADASDLAQQVDNADVGRAMDEIERLIAEVS